MDFKKYANLAHKIVKQTEEKCYIDNRSIVEVFFKTEKADKNIVVNRLRVIDEFYSTHMYTRKFGIEEIANFISKKSDIELKDLFLDFLKNPHENQEILELFNKPYGYNKNGSSKAFSIISKYAYFLCEYNFPIYDSKVKEYLPKLLAQYNIFINKGDIDKNIIDFIIYIKKTIEILKIDDFDKLDSLIWLYWKLNTKGFSAFINYEYYIEKFKGQNNSQIDDHFIKNWYSDKDIKKILGNDLLEFIKCLEVNILQVEKKQ